ncbi:MAG: hypothetical protein K0R21_213 [Anaerocolumna sp.]|jgi:hypothetical protein|nr:hypothetical protein [Anaerocolumna sp.]
MFYDDEVSDFYVETDYENESDLTDKLNTLMDIDLSGATSTSEVVDGLNTYFSELGLANTANYLSSFSFSMVQTRINNNRPVIIDTDNHPDFGEHWITAHGYYNSALMDDYVIVNNGWGDNNVWVIVDQCLDDIVYFSK